MLRLAGARISAGTVISPGLRLENLDRHRGLAALRMGKDCYLGHDVHLDLADDITLGDQVTLATRCLVNTHLSVGYADHPLQPDFPRSTSPVVVEAGSFIGAGTILLAGTKLGPRTFVAAGSVVMGEHPGSSLLAGAPARVVRRLESETEPAATKS